MKCYQVRLIDVCQQGWQSRGGWGGGGEEVFSPTLFPKKNKDIIEETLFSPLPPPPKKKCSAVPGQLSICNWKIFKY